MSPARVAQRGSEEEAQPWQDMGHKGRKHHNFQWPEPPESSFSTQRIKIRFGEHEQKHPRGCSGSSAPAPGAAL